MTRMKIELASDVDGELVEGRFYLVPTVSYIWNGIQGDWPVLGPKHEDGDLLDFPYQHYHVDLRFLSKEQIDRTGMDEVYLSGTPLCRTGFGDRKEVEAHPTSVLRRRKCRTAKIVSPRDHHGFFSHALPKLEAAYKDKRLIKTAAGVFCPHRNAPMAGIKPDCRGHIVCPLHGLKWDASTGEMVSSTQGWKADDVATD